MTHIAGKPSIQERGVCGINEETAKGAAKIRAKNRQNKVVAKIAKGAGINPYS
jgi:hypothetical protein